MKSEFGETSNGTTAFFDFKQKWLDRIPFKSCTMAILNPRLHPSDAVERREYVTHVFAVGNDNCGAQELWEKLESLGTNFDPESLNTERAHFEKRFEVADKHLVVTLWNPGYVIALR
jgi:hypothetical protein